MNQMNKFSVILLMAGSSTRFNQNINKSLYELNKKPLFLYSLDKFVNLDIRDIFVVTKESELENIKTNICEDYNYLKYVIGGDTRQESVKNALKLVTTEYVLIHDAARPLTNINDIITLVNKMVDSNYPAGTLYHEVTDTIKEVSNKKVSHLDRNKLFAVTTPQCFRKDVYEKILSNESSITDELSVLENEQILFVKETSNNIKVTTFDDYEYMNYLLNKNNDYKIGHSYDYHNFKEGEKLILGGIEIPSLFGLDGYSDADVVYHSVCEAILGALGLADIGTIFPDNAKENYKRNSKEFVDYALRKLDDAKYSICNVDIMIYLQKPNLKNYKFLIKENLQKILKTKEVNVKATTLEKQGLIGTCQGIGTETVILIKRF